jgi:nitroimidazol reductase NimA-like FMN-containing flavoprotein (pyridoxamine 5'-phosphate oxidase superfamily)
MIKPEREIKSRQTIEAMLERTPVGRIATINRKGFPVIKPVNFLYEDGKIYIHSSLKGEKIVDIRRGSPLCFEVDEPIAFVATRESACSASYCYRSIIAKGKASLVRRGKKTELFARLMQKYQQEGGYGKMSENVLQKTALIEISIQELTAKENLA